MELRKNIENILASSTLALKAKVDQMRDDGENVISFTVGEPDFDTPENIKEAGKYAIDHNYTHYTPSIGLRKLREAIVTKFKIENNLSYNYKQIAVGNGAKHCLSNAMFVLLNKGDEVLIPKPYWLSYPVMVEMAGGTSVFLETCEENDYKVTAKQLEENITSKTKVVILNSPSNPTGIVYTEEELAAFVPIIKKTGVFVISDDIYEKLTYDNVKHVSLANFPEIKEQVLVINGVSKAFAMTGWRIGYIACQQEIIEAIAKIQSHFTGNPCSVSQHAALFAIEENLRTDKELQCMKATFEKRRDLALELLRDIPGITCRKPGGAFYLFPRVDSFYKKKYGEKIIQSSSDISNYLLDHYKVAVVPGKDFGCDNNFRMSFAASDDEIIEGIRRIREGLLNLE